MKYSDLKRAVEKDYIKDDWRKTYSKTKLKAKKKFTLDLRLVLMGSVFLAVSLFVFFAVWVCVNVEPTVNQKIERWMSQSKGRNFEINSFEYRDFSISLKGMVFTQVQARGVIRYDYPYFQPRQFELDIPILHIYPRWGLRSGLRLGMSFNGLEIKGGPLLPGVQESRRRLDAISNLTFQTWISIGGSPWRWKRNLVGWARQFKNWALNGARMSSVYMGGDAKFIADGVAVKVYFFSRKEKDGQTHLEGDWNDMRQIAHVIEPKFTDEDVSVAAKNLLKTPKLLNIRTRAEKKAEEMHKPDSDFNYDIPRHIFWSYWLTQAFGPDFAFQVTDAHEIGDLGNTTEEHKKDRHINTLGIEYAQRKLSEKEVEQMIYTDSRIPRT